MSETLADDPIVALQTKFPAATSRDSRDHPAVNVPIAEAHAALQWLRDEKGYEKEKKKR